MTWKSFQEEILVFNRLYGWKDRKGRNRTYDDKKMSQRIDGAASAERMYSSGRSK